jgi:hypothetical protein
MQIPQLPCSTAPVLTGWWLLYKSSWPQLLVILYCFNECSLYRLSKDCIENAVLPSNGPTDLYCDIMCSLPQRGVYCAVAQQWTSLVTPLFWFLLSCHNMFMTCLHKNIIFLPHKDKKTKLFYIHQQFA